MEENNRNMCVRGILCYIHGLQAKMPKTKERKVDAQNEKST
jgi:hypothetical protein